MDYYLTPIPSPKWRGESRNMILKSLSNMERDLGRGCPLKREIQGGVNN
jgi:hypothetical protein